MDKETKKQFQNLVAVVGKGFARTDRRFDKTDKKIDEKIEGLARIVKKGFDDVDEKFDQNQKEHAEIRLDLEEISSKLTGVVYRPELIEFEQRLQRIEMKLGLAK